MGPVTRIKHGKQIYELTMVRGKPAIIMNPTTEFLTPHDIKKIHEEMLRRFGGEKGFLFEGGIHFIADKVKHLMEQETLEEQAAAYLYEIATTHPFINGNKRTAYVSADVFLRMNGHFLGAPPEENEKFMLKVARGEIDFLEVVIWIRNNMASL